jgi:2-amino-4-hydroxy-6-hydroxymethyldihydropteridine diphosphokinase
LIDIDIVLYADEIIAQGYDLTIPHPEMQHRKFVLQPLAEIAPLAKHPVFKKTITEMLEDLTDFLTVEKIID